MSMLIYIIIALLVLAFIGMLTAGAVLLIIFLCRKR